MKTLALEDGIPTTGFVLKKCVTVARNASRIFLEFGQNQICPG